MIRCLSSKSKLHTENIRTLSQVKHMHDEVVNPGIRAVVTTIHRPLTPPAIRLTADPPELWVRKGWSPVTVYRTNRPDTIWAVLEGGRYRAWASLEILVGYKRSS